MAETKKGFILTLDVMMALVLGAALISSIMYFLNQPKPNTDEYLYSVSDDFLTVADKDGSIIEALEGDSTSIGDFVDEMPNNLCLNLTVVNESNGVLFSGASGCPEPVKYVIGKRTIVNNTRNYIAKLRVWYK